MGNASLLTVPQTVKTPVPVEQLLDYVMPIYYTKIPLKPHCKEKLIASWKKIIGNKAEGFYKMKKEHPDLTPCPNPMEYFANRIIIRLMEVHPVCQGMFVRGSLKNGLLMMNLISVLVKEMDNPEGFEKHLKMIATSHTKFGIRASEFGIYGEVLFWTLRLVLGDEDYDVVTHTAWIKFYSRMLDVIVPIMLKYEMEHIHEAKEFTAKRMMPIMETKALVLKGIHQVEPASNSAHVPQSAVRSGEETANSE